MISLVKIFTSELSGNLKNFTFFINDMRIPAESETNNLWRLKHRNVFFSHEQERARSSVLRLNSNGSTQMIFEK